MKVALVAVLLVLICIHLKAEDVGTLKGSVQFDGVAPESKIQEITADRKSGCTCDQVLDESLIVDKVTNGLKWAVVRIIDVKAADAPPNPTGPIQIDQKGCLFTPHVVVVPPNTELEILNPDAIMHNIHTTGYDSANPNQNVLHSANETKKLFRGAWLKEPEIIEVKCDIHSWMKGLIVVHDPRFCFVTGADGSFEIKNVPAGKYEINVFHERFGEKTIKMEIKVGATTDVGAVKFASKKK